MTMRQSDQDYLNLARNDCVRDIDMTGDVKTS